ncbi:hypothetical protein WBG78_20390 [Chryseolinea sp. T2]|uniref:hypothetical protein n=1 Tax=Chryseolinea sp. T2 TaxID=3129255 RepID=UPI003076FB3B
MKISVQQDWLGRYKFFTDGGENPSFSGAGVSRIFKRDYASIYDAEGETIMVLRHGTHSPWKLDQSYYLVDDYRSNRTIEVKCVNYKKGHWAFGFNEINYEVFFHGTSKKSLYRNGEQVAKFSRVRSQHFIVANDDEDVLLLIALFMAFKMGDSAPDDDIILDVFEDARAEDVRWHPVK